MRLITSRPGCLRNGDLATFVFLRLRNHDAEDTILHGSLDVFLVNANREAEASRELAHAALRDPEFGLRLVFLDVLSLIAVGGGDFGRGLLLLAGMFILDGGLVSCVLARLAALDGSSGGLTFDEAGGWGALGVGALGVAFDCQSLGVGEFNLDVLLLDAGEFAVEFVGVSDLLDVELGAKDLEVTMRLASAVVVVAAPGVLVEVVEQTEERSERGGGIGSDERSWEEGHCACMRNVNELVGDSSNW